MTDLSLLARLEALSGSGEIPMHMPGHKRNTSLAGYLDVLQAALDITEITGFDDLHTPEGILQQAQDRAAALWGARKSWFLVNGSTGGVLAGIRALAPAGSRVLVARNCHRSVYNALELCRLRPAFVMPDTVPGWSFSGPVTPASLSAAIARWPDARLLILTSPTYEGIISDLPALVRLAHAANIPVLVDEAHGAHLGLYGVFPAGAVAAGADLVIQSLHKTLPSLTQTAILHCAGPMADPAAVQAQLAVFQTSSPSYLLMASIDGCVRWLEEQGLSALSAWQTRLESFYRKTDSLRRLRLLGGQERLPFLRDTGKIVIGAGPLTGRQLKDQLRKRFSMELEMAGGDWTLAMTGPGDTETSLAALAQALCRLDAELPTAPATAPLLPWPLTKAPLAPWQAAERRAELVPVEQAVGRISAESVWAYPPGIPVLIPGEQLDPQMAALFAEQSRRDVTLRSTRGGMPEKLWVLCETDPDSGIADPE